MKKYQLGVGNEIQLTDAIKLLLKTNPIYSYEFTGTRYDCGSKLGFIKANISFAFKMIRLRDELKDLLKIYYED